MQCVSCLKTRDIGYTEWDLNQPCWHCGKESTIKPDVVFFKEGAPRYRDMRILFSQIKSQDIVVVIGTKCDVIPFDRILVNIPCRRIFNSLNPLEEIGPEALKIFDYVFAQEATKAVLEIDTIISAWMSEN